MADGEGDIGVDFDGFVECGAGFGVGFCPSDLISERGGSFEIGAFREGKDGDVAGVELDGVGCLMEDGGGAGLFREKLDIGGGGAELALGGGKNDDGDGSADDEAGDG